MGGDSAQEEAIHGVPNPDMAANPFISDDFLTALSVRLNEAVEF